MNANAKPLREVLCFAHPSRLEHVAAADPRRPKHGLQVGVYVHAANKCNQFFSRPQGPSPDRHRHKQSLGRFCAVGFAFLNEAQWLHVQAMALLENFVANLLAEPFA